MAGKVRPPGIIMCPALERLNPSLTIHPAKSADLFGVLTATGAAPRPGTRKGKPRGFAVAITDLPLFSMLRTKMQWHQERQRLLAENVANADTPKFKPRDLAPPQFDRAQPAGVALAQTSAAHIASSTASGAGQFQLERRGDFET